ncbi:sensor histidine kinase [Actinomyces qiguomingii]|uniref:sensor histidine kinase n=1 Tax=Actinomyces qiguomingii TaxID=2057800 RepID=UPI0013047C79|nr:histidine kinase [Actinomyces qiguomingii]
MAMQVAVRAMRSFLTTLPGRFWVFTVVAAVLLGVDIVSVFSGTGPTGAIWSSIVVAALGVLAGLSPGVGGGLVIAACALVHILPEQIALSGAALVLAYFVLVMWVAKGWYLRFIAGVAVEQGALWGEYPSTSAFIESTAVVVLLCSAAGYLIGEYQCREEKLAQRVHVLEVESQLAESRIRAALGADLHDTVATDLTHIILRCQIAGSGQQEAAAVLAGIEQDVRAALQRVRSVVAVLRPTVDETPASWKVQEVAHECADMLRTRGFDVDAEIEGADGECQPDTVHGELLGLVLREAAVNVLKYAAHKGEVSITVSLGKEGDGVTVSSALPDACDRVEGSHVPVLRGGQGLDIMRDRIQSGGGELHVGPVGSRWVVTCILPPRKE